MSCISRYQLFILTVFFQVGTTVIFGFGAAAGRDAWIVSALSTIIGLLMIGVYLMIFHLNPGLTLVDWYTTQFGKWLGTPIAWLYPLLFLYEVGRILNDIKFLITSSILVNTPFWAIITLFTLLVAYSQYCGIEVLGRVGEILLPFFLLLFVLEIILLLGSDEIEIENLQPILEHGWTSVLKASWPLGASQGFAQTLELAMIWPYIKSIKDTAKATVFATILSGLVITFGNLLAITTLSEVVFQHQSFPLYVVIQKINVGDLIKHLDVLGILYFMISAFFKIALHMFVAIQSIQKLTYIKNDKKLILPLAVLAIYLGHSVASNFSEHVQVALEIFPYTLWILLLWILPTILLIVTLIRNSFKKRRIFSNV